MRIKKTVFLCLSALWLILQVHAQETTTPVPLEQILMQVTQTSGYRFNYAPATIEDIELAPPGDGLTIKEILRYLTDETGLQFSELPNKFISIRPASLILCGTVTDEATENPLAYATVQSGAEAVITDEKGYFELKIKGGEDQISVRFMGYRSFEGPVGDYKAGECLNIALRSQQLKLAEIVLYDYLIRGIDQLDDGSYSIDFNRFSILPGLIDTDVLQAVQAFPGIHSVNETVSEINIRGGTNDQNLILWDGIKMYQSGHFFGLISMFNPMITQKVSLRTNGTPSSLTDGVSGTISLESEDKLNQDFSGSLSGNFIDVSGFVDTPLGKNSSIQIAARKAINDFVESPTYSEYFSRISQDTEVENNVINVVNSDQSFDFYDTSLRWLWQISDSDQLRLNFIYAKNGLIFNENAEIGNDTETRESSLEQGTLAAGLNYKRRWNDKVDTELQVYNTDYKLQAINANILNNQRFLQENTVSETAARLNTNLSVDDRLQWSLGYMFTETKVTNLDDVDDPVFRRLEGNVLRVHSGFTALAYSSENRASVARIGLRYNYLSKLQRHLVEPRLSFNQRIGHGFNVELLGEFKHQNTSQIVNFQNDFLGIEKRRWQLSNDEDIPVITSKQGSVGLSFNRSGWLIKAAGFYKEVDNITTQSQGFQNQYEFTSAIGSYTASGLDLLLRKQLKNLTTWLSYSQLNADYNFQTLPEQEFPSNYDITHALTLGLTYETNRLRLATGWNWRTGKPTTLPDNQEPVINNTVNFQGTNSTRFSDYMRVDLSALYALCNGPGTRAQIGFSLWNLLNRENTVSRYFRANSMDEANAFSQNSLGFTPNAVFRVDF
ncbi:TonB-dependent receptor [Muriicola soli]|uniref:TonB-dependent receptor n=1 Tax=Muriicola soli TaxID=2507538 RepID=A0A411EAL8_9FLAO|nr:carboxypeptidase-like regulatory domain-containing protein [Muriicola soli]QBA64762.1 TonB-dependent receptor [Muriicola soli]